MATHQAMGLLALSLVVGGEAAAQHVHHGPVGVLAGRPAVHAEGEGRLRAARSRSWRDQQVKT